MSPYPNTTCPTVKPLRSMRSPVAPADSAIDAAGFGSELSAPTTAISSSTNRGMPIVISSVDGGSVERASRW